MKLPYVFIANAIFAAFGALSLLIVPEKTFSSYGATLNPSGLFVAHILGVTVLGIAVMSYLLKDVKDKVALNAVLLGFIIAHVGSAIFAIMAATNGLFNQMVWGDIIIHGTLAATFGYYWSKR